MGRLGLIMTNASAISSDVVKAKPEVSFRDLPMVMVEEKAVDRPFDKALAYLSYYVMVFVTCCVFIPTHTSGAVAATFDLVADTIVMAGLSQPGKSSNILSHEHYKWILRDTR